MSASTSHSQMARANHAAAPSMEQQREIANAEREHRESGSAQYTGLPQDMGLIPFARDRFDEKAAMLRELNTATPDSAIGNILGLPGDKVMRTRNVSDAELDYVRRVKDQQEQVLFDQWILSKFDLTLPTEVDRIRKMYPEFWERQKAYVNSRFDVMRRFVDLKMFGIQTMEDAKFLWLLENGHITLPTGFQTYAELSGGSGANAGPSDAIYRGMFNVLRYTKPKELYDSGAYGYSQQNKAYPFAGNDANNRGNYLTEDFWTFKGSDNVGLRKAAANQGRTL